jgi:hypothetical protein
MSRFRLAFLTAASVCVFAVCLMVCGPAHAEGFYLQAHGGISTLNLDDVNTQIDILNEGFPAGEQLDHINSGWDAGLTVGYSINGNLDLGLGYSRLFAGSEFSEDSYLVALDVPADLYEITLDYLPPSESRFRVGAGLDIGAVRSAASFEVSDPVIFESRTVDFKGVGFLFAGYGIVDASLAGKWSIYGEGGFRHALINELKVDGETVYNPDSLDDKLRFNYSGIFLRVGVTFRP